jgi:hypothetical protein
MKIKRLMTILLGVGFLFLVSSCEYDWIEPTKGPIVPTPDTVSYSLNIQPIWDANCAMSGCHSSSGWDPPLTADKSYNELINNGFVNLAVPTESEIYKVIRTGSMSQYSNSTNNALVLKWIQQGAKNN